MPVNQCGRFRDAVRWRSVATGHSAFDGAPSGPRAVLLDVAGAAHLPRGQLLCAGERLIGRNLPDQGRGKLLTDRGRDTLELGDRSKLHADIGLRLRVAVETRICRIDGL